MTIQKQYFRLHWCISTTFCGRACSTHSCLACLYCPSRRQVRWNTCIIPWSRNRSAEPREKTVLRRDRCDLTMYSSASILLLACSRLDRHASMTKASLHLQLLVCDLVRSSQAMRVTAAANVSSPSVAFEDCRCIMENDSSRA